MDSNVSQRYTAKWEVICTRVLAIAKEDSITSLGPLPEQINGKPFNNIMCKL